MANALVSGGPSVIHTMGNAIMANPMSPTKTMAIRVHSVIAAILSGWRIGAIGRLAGALCVCFHWRYDNSTPVRPEHLGFDLRSHRVQ